MPHRNRRIKSSKAPSPTDTSLHTCSRNYKLVILYSTQQQTMHLPMKDAVAKGKKHDTVFLFLDNIYVLTCIWFVKTFELLRIKDCDIVCWVKNLTYSWLKEFIYIYVLYARMHILHYIPLEKVTWIIPIDKIVHWN